MVVTIFAFSMIALTSCGGDDDSPTDGGNGNGSGVELFQNAEQLWIVTDDTISPDYCSPCDSYTLTWQSTGWQLTGTFDGYTSCFSSECDQVDIHPFVVKELTVTPHFDVSPYQTATLRWTESLTDYSGIVVYVSPDGGSTWTLVSDTDHTSATTTQNAREVEITQYLGSARDDVRIQFVLVVGTAQFPRKNINDAYTCRATATGLSLQGYN